MAGFDVDKILADVNDDEFDDDNWNDVCQELRRFAANWKKIGRALGLAAYQLEEIEGNHHKNSECLDKMLEVWIGQNYSVEKFGLPSWRTLCKALSQVADMKYFKELAVKHQVVGGGGASVSYSGANDIAASSGSTTAATSEEDKRLSATPKLNQLSLLKYTKNGEKKKLNIISRASHKWRQIAEQLSDDPNLASKLDQKHHDPTECLRQVFIDCFINKKPANCTHDWSGIIELLDDIDEEALSEEVRTAVLSK